MKPISGGAIKKFNGLLRSLPHLEELKLEIGRIESIYDVFFTLFLKRFHEFKRLRSLEIDISALKLLHHTTIITLLSEISTVPNLVRLKIELPSIRLDWNFKECQN